MDASVVALTKTIRHIMGTAALIRVNAAQQKSAYWLDRVDASMPIQPIYRNRGDVADNRRHSGGKSRTLRRRGAVLFAILAINVLGCCSGHELFISSAAAQQQPSASAVQNLSVVMQNWHRYQGLAVADIIFNNANAFAVRHVIIGCDFLDPKGNVIATRATTIFESLPPASTVKIDGVHFSLREKSATPGSCRVISVRTASQPN
jgi:hypothetical protein